MSSTHTTSSRDEHNAGRRAREVYRYFRPERLSAIDEGTTPNSSANSRQISLQSSDRSISRSGSPCAPSQSPSAFQAPLEPATAPMSPMPESLVLGNANTTLNSFAQLAAMRLGMGRVYIRQALPRTFVERKSK